jgi:putative drug exporter of the RND superfamily
MDRPSVLLHAEDTATGPPRRGRAPAVERIAGWSARHRKTALIGWLLLVAGAVVIGSMLGTKNLNSYDPGQAGRAERVLARPGVVQQPIETVLVQARASGRTVASDPEPRRATADQLLPAQPRRTPGRVQP